MGMKLLQSSAVHGIKFKIQFSEEKEIKWRDTGWARENCSLIDSNSGGLFIYFFFSVSFPVLPISFSSQVEIVGFLYTIT